MHISKYGYKPFKAKIYEVLATITIMMVFEV